MDGDAMRFLQWIGLGKEIADPIRAVGDLYTTDKARIKAEAAYQDIIQKPGLAQLENNKLLVLTGKLFNAGWVPLLGWSCGFLILLFYAPQILVVTYVWGSECIHLGRCTPFPMKADDLVNLVYLLLGMGGIGVFKNKSN